MDAEAIGTWAAILITATAFVAGAWGWVMNIVALLHSGDATGTLELVMRGVGIFIAPVGAVLGYF